MPNWCRNKLIVKSNGNSNELLRFINQGIKQEIVEGLTENVWRLSNYIPMPEEYMDVKLTDDQRNNLLEKYGYRDWSNWATGNWGVEWDCDNIGCMSYTDENSYYELHFDSAWCPPIVGLITISQMFPNLSFQIEYMEVGIQFAGVCLIDKGMILDLFGLPIFHEEIEENDESEEESVTYFEKNPFSGFELINNIKKQTYETI